ncbi:MAG: hypothetical protein AB8I08_38215 [Sandaracinaceae bacterium]
MPFDTALLEGRPEAVSAMLAEGWAPLLAHVLAEPAPTPKLLEELHRQAPKTGDWWNGVQGATSAYERSHNVLLSMSVVRKAYFAWLEASCEGIDPAHPLRLEVQVDEVRRTTGNLDRVQALYDRLDGAPTGETHRGALAAVGAQRALEAGQPARAVTFAKTAAEVARRDGDAKKLDVAARLLAGAHMEARDFDAAFALYDLLLEQRGPRFGGGMAVSMAFHTDAQAEALSDIRTIGGWARRDTPEWVRALGSLALAFEDDAHGEELRVRFEDAVHDLTAGERAVDDLEVVLRQLDERGHFKASLIASRIGTEAIPGDTWLLSAYANQAARAHEHADALDAYRRLAGHADAGRETQWFAWEQAGAMAARQDEHAAADEAWTKARALAATDEQRWSVELSVAEARGGSHPDVALERARGVHDAIRSNPQMLAESTVGHRCVDVLTRLLEKRGDRAALDVQTSLLAAKKALWGADAPAAWVEQHNLGAVHAGLGENDEARRLVTEAHTKLLALCGPHHPHTELCERTLARLERGQP